MTLGAGLWLADYTGDGGPGAWPFVAIRQTGSSGRVNGIATNVDTDTFYGTRDQLARYAVKGGTTVSAYDDVNAETRRRLAALGVPQAEADAFDLAETVKALKDVDATQDKAARAGAHAILDTLGS